MIQYIIALYLTANLFLYLGNQNSSDLPVTKIKKDLIILCDVIPDQKLQSAFKTNNIKIDYNFYQSGDPQAKTSGVIDVAAVLKAIRKETNGNPPEWGQLDFEDPFTDNLQSGPNSPEYKRAVKTLTETIRAVKLEFPNTKWTSYCIPLLPFWLDGKGWSTADNTLKKVSLERCVQQYQSLVNELDWICPTIYAKHDPSMYTESQGKWLMEEGRAWRMAQVGISKLLAGGKPVIPATNIYWVPGSKAKFCHLISEKEIMTNIVIPSITAGVDGFAIWTSYDFLINQAIENKNKGEPDFGPTEWRAALITDYLNGINPVDWSNPNLREKLLYKSTQSILSTAVNIRMYEKLRK